MTMRKNVSVAGVKRLEKQGESGVELLFWAGVALYPSLPIVGSIVDREWEADALLSDGLSRQRDTNPSRTSFGAV